MLTLKKALSSSVGKKYIMALSGLALVGFMITHLAANLLLLLPNGVAFNQYAYKLASFGWLLYVAEIGLALAFLIHAVSGIRLAVGYRAARPERYRTWKSKGGPSKANLSSLYMILTGVILFGFLIFHVSHFKFGPSLEEGYVSEVNQVQMRDLHRLVIESFQNPVMVGFYMFVMLLLGLHLRHGFWSAFQSLGMMHPRYSRQIYALGIFIAVLMGVGFFMIPLWIYLDIGRLLQ